MKREDWVGISPSVITHIHVMSAVQWDDVPNFNFPMPDVLLKALAARVSK